MADVTVYSSKPEASNLYTIGGMHRKHEKWAEHVIKGVYMRARDNHVEVVEACSQGMGLLDLLYIY